MRYFPCIPYTPVPSSHCLSVSLLSLSLCLSPHPLCPDPTPSVSFSLPPLSLFQVYTQTWNMHLHTDSLTNTHTCAFLLQGRSHIFKIHAAKMSVEKDIRFELLARLCPNSTGMYVCVYICVCSMSTYVTRSLIAIGPALPAQNLIVGTRKSRGGPVDKPIVLYFS